MLHPGDAARGSRTLEFDSTVLIPKSEISEGMSMIRLKDLFNVNVEWDHGIPSFSFGGDSLADARAAKARIIQWLPSQDAVPCTLLTQEGGMTGACEPLVRTERGNVVQFERVGFARIDAEDATGIRAYFTHK
jgi:glutamyl-tRNA synthetase